jgi:phosphate transport system permease protein
MTRRRKATELVFKTLMRGSIAVLVLVFTLIMAAICVKGLPTLSLELLFTLPQGGFYSGKSGGILNAIVGSLLLALAGSGVALLISVPLVWYIRIFRRPGSRVAEAVRFACNVLWGVPSIVYGAFGVSLMLLLRLPASLLAGILVLALIQLPVLSRALDEVVGLVPPELKEATLALGATRVEYANRIVFRQTSSGLITALLLAFGRGVGEAAAVMLTAGFSDRLPTSLLDPVASLPLAIFFQIQTPFPAVQERAYGAALILTALILAVSMAGRALAGRAARFKI